MTAAELSLKGEIDYLQGHGMTEKSEYKFLHEFARNLEKEILQQSKSRLRNPHAREATSGAHTRLPDEITLTLPYPVSANRYWRSFVPRGHKRAIVTLSDEAKSYKSQVGWMCKQAGIRKPITGRVHVEIYLYPKRPLDYAKRMKKNPDGWDDDVQCIDLDNARKVLYDALKGIAFDDDKWIFSDGGARMEPDGEARVVVVIRQIQRHSSQGELL